MRSQKLLLAALAIIASSALFARPTQAAVEPWHNPHMALDVDDNHLVTPRDALLIINRLTRPLTAEPAVNPPPVDLTSVFYWDTTNDGDVTPRDSLIVINQLIVPTPEPSSIALAGLGLTMLVGYAWRRRRKALLGI